LGVAVGDVVERRLLHRLHAVSLSPARGALGSVLLALIGAALLLVSRLVGLDGRDLHIPNVVFWSITTFTAVPLLAGAMAARSRVASVATAAPAR
jgi:hypothetical protein